MQQTNGMDAEIFKLGQRGIMSVYMRKVFKPKYFVLRETDGHILEEFRQKRSAFKFAKENQNG